MLWWQKPPRNFPKSKPICYWLSVTSDERICELRVMCFIGYHYRYSTWLAKDSLSSESCLFSVNCSFSSHNLVFSVVKSSFTLFSSLISSQALSSSFFKVTMRITRIQVKNQIATKNLCKQPLITIFECKRSRKNCNTCLVVAVYIYRSSLSVLLLLFFSSLFPDKPPSLALQWF